MKSGLVTCKDASWPITFVAHQVSLTGSREEPNYFSVNELHADGFISVCRNVQMLDFATGSLAQETRATT